MIEEFDVIDEEEEEEEEEKEEKRTVDVSGFEKWSPPDSVNAVTVTFGGTTSTVYIPLTNDPQALLLSLEISDVGEGQIRAAMLDTVELDVPSCSICQSDCIVGHTVLTPCCQKSFHTHCISEWLQIKNNCPLCRSNL